MILTNLFSHITGLISADATVIAAGITVLSQLDPDYHKKYEAALRAKGMIFVLWSAGSDAANGNSMPQLDLQNHFLLSVVESSKNLGVGQKTSIEWVSYLLRLLHQCRAQGRSPTADIRHPSNGPVYELGPLGQGLVVYFIYLDVRSTEPLLTT
jgi:hypothetical protein